MLTFIFLAAILLVVITQPVVPFFNKPPPVQQPVICETSEKSPTLGWMEVAVDYFRNNMTGRTCGNTIPDDIIGGCTLSYGSGRNQPDGGGRVYICGYHENYGSTDPDCGKVADSLSALIYNPNCPQLLNNVMRVGGRSTIVHNDEEGLMTNDEIYLNVRQDAGPI